MLKFGFYLYILDVHGMCIKVKKKIRYKMYGFQLSKGWCVFFYSFGTVLQSVVYFLICTV